MKILDTLKCTFHSFDQDKNKAVVINKKLFFYIFNFLFFIFYLLVFSIEITVLNYIIYLFNKYSLLYLQLINYYL